MADTKTTALTELASGSQADTDVLPIVDVSDTTQGAGGTLKKFTWSSIKAALKSYFDGLYSPTGPAFKAYRNTSNQSITASTITKVDLNSESFDSNSCFDTTTSRFTPNIAGYYHFSWGLRIRSSGFNIVDVAALLYKNTDNVAQSEFVAATNCSIISMVGSTLTYMNGTTDYVELHAYANATSPFIEFGEKNTYLTGYLVRK